MGIFSRLNSVIKSNLNSLVDKAEDPEKLIGQTIIDMEAELKRARRELVSALATAKQLDKKQADLVTEAAGWEDKAALALRQGDEELAREALRRKVRSLREADAAKQQSAQQATTADQMKDTLDHVERKISDLKAKKGTLAAQVRRAREAPSAAPGGPTGSRFGSETFDELDRMTGRIDQLEAEVEAAQALDGGPSKAELDARFRALEKHAGSDAVEDELAALKNKLGD